MCAVCARCAGLFPPRRVVNLTVPAVRASRSQSPLFRLPRAVPEQPPTDLGGVMIWVARYPHFSVILSVGHFSLKMFEMIQNDPSKTSPNGAKTASEPCQTTPKRPATTPHASHATIHTSTAAMGWENARPDRPPPAPRGAHFPTPWPCGGVYRGVAGVGCVGGSLGGGLGWFGYCFG